MQIILKKVGRVGSISVMSETTPQKDNNTEMGETLNIKGKQLMQGDMQNIIDLCIMIEIIQQQINILEKERKGNPKTITLQKLSQ